MATDQRLDARVKIPQYSIVSPSPLTRLSGIAINRWSKKIISGTQRSGVWCATI